jgi:vacuolar-type H+-ATPase subunit H
MHRRAEKRMRVADEKAIRMGSLIEATIKALIEFESELDRMKAEELEIKKKMVKDAVGLAELAKSEAISKAQQQVADKLDKARAEGADKAESIRKKGESSLKSLEASISRRKAKAIEEVVSRLMGEPR